MKCPQCNAANDEGVAHCFTCGASLSATTVIKKGAVIAARYEIQETLGKGGMGTVYKAYDHILDEQVALKVLRPDMVGELDMARRFRLEIKLARKVRHKNVCGIHEYGEDGGLRFISMEFIDGVDLRKVLSQRGTPSMAEAFDVSIAVALGLQAIHEAGIIHRDLKTPNIMVDAAGQVRLMDFGIAKQHGGTGATLSGTAMGMIVGTPEYMSPEQGRGEKVDFRSDVYALGIVVFEIFTGSVPFRGETPIATIFKHLQEPPPLTGPRAARLPPSLVPVLARALAKTADERFASVAELVEGLKQARTVALAAAPAMEAVQGTVVLKLDPASSGHTPSPTAVPTSVRTAVRPTPDDAAERQREQALQQASTQIERALARGALDDAASALEQARTQLADAQALATLALKIDEARRQAEQARQRAEKEAQKRAEDEKRRAEEQARRQAEEAERRAEQDRKRAEQERQRAEEAQRQKLRAAALAEVEQLLRNGDVDGAARSHADALAAYGTATDLAALGGRIEKARQRAAEEQALAELLQRAEALLSARDFDKAHQAAQEAARRAPSDGRTRSLVTRVEGEWRTHAVAETTGRVQAAMQQGAFDEAESQLREAEKGLGKATFKTLRKELENRRAAARKQQAAAAAPSATPSDAAGTAAGQRTPAGPGSAIKIAVAAGAVFVLLAGGILWRVLSSPKPKPKTEDVAGPSDKTTPAPGPAGSAQGSLVIDALPWGEVTEVVDASGKSHSLGEERFTPLLLSLPAGDYTVSVRDPLGSAPARLKVSVPVAGNAQAKAEFRPVRVEDYFNRMGFK